MKLSKFALIAASAMAIATASSANATVLISGLLIWKSGTLTESLAGPLKQLSFSFQADSPTSVNLGSFQAKLNGSTVAVTPDMITFNPTGFQLHFAAPYSLNFTTGYDWTVMFPPTPWAIGSVLSQVNGSGPTTMAQISILSVPSVPEPATWALMLGGFALAGLTLRTSIARYKVRYAA
jgi:hypothetical protein